MSQASSIVLLGRGGPSPPPWPPPPRAPLPPFPAPTETQPGLPQAGCWTHDAFATALPFVPPDTPDLDFHRGNVMGLRVPGLPFVGGGTDLDPSFLVTWFLHEYSEADQNKALDAYQAAGYTHWDFHRAAWMGLMTKEGVTGCSKETALVCVRKVADRGMFPIVNLAVYDQQAPDPNELKPWIDDLAAAGMRIGCLAWQADQLLTPMQLWAYILWAAPYLHAKGCKVAVHWGALTDACAWWDDETCATYGVCNRFDFQRKSDGLIDYPYNQVGVNAAILDNRPNEGGILGNLLDIMRSLKSQKLVMGEDDMQAEFNDPMRRLELYGDLKGRCLQTASGFGQRMWGYLNGARQVDGSVL